MVLGIGLRLNEHEAKARPHRPQLSMLAVVNLAVPEKIFLRTQSDQPRFFHLR